jgi:hypothetical protein
MRLNEEDKKRINKYFSDKSSEDRKWLSDLFCDQQNDDDLEKIMKEKWYSIKEVQNERNLDPILHRIHYNINTSRVKINSQSRVTKIFRTFARIAAVIIFPLAIYSGIHIYKSSYENKLAWVEIKAPAWTRARFVLPDSTTGWLNSNSSIRYRSDYYRNRNLVLKGEAYFDVFKDKQRPFTVEANNVMVEATGTRFNVSSYTEEDKLEIVLEEGGLLINEKDSKNSLEVLPNELITYSKKQDGFTKEYVQTQKYISWTEGKLVFRNDPIDVIARRLGRWYNVDVQVEGDNFDLLRLRATFVDENLEQVLYFLKRSLPIDYKIIDGNVGSEDVMSKKKVIITMK